MLGNRKTSDFESLVQERYRGPPLY